MSTRFERARAALKRMGWKDDEIADLPREQAIRRGLKAQRQLDRQALAHAEAQRAQEELRALKEGKTLPASTNGVRSEQNTAPLVDFARLAEPFAEYGDEVRDKAKATFEAALSPLLAKLAQLEQTSERSASQRSEADQVQRFERARSELVGTFPDLADNDDFGDIVRTAASMKYLAQFAGHQTDDAALKRLITAAARAMEFEEVGERESPGLPQSGAGRGRLDLPSVRTNAKGAPRSLTPTPQELQAAVVSAVAKRTGSHRRLATSA